MKVSVIIPCFNCEEYVEDTIKSVINQTYEKIEIICVNNNSTDGTQHLLEKLKADFPNISLYHEERAGANYARNLGLSKATGDYVQFLDADDLIDRSKIESQVNVISGKEADIVISDRAVYNEDLSQKIEEIKFTDFLSGNLVANAVASILITGNPLYKTSFVKRIGGYLEGLKSAQDWEFHIRAFLNNPVTVYKPGFFLSSRTVGDSLSSDYIEVSDNACKVIEIHKKALVEKQVQSDFEATKKIIFTYLISYINSNRNQDYFNELLFWYEIAKDKRFFSKKLNWLVSVFGISFIVKLKFIINRFR